MLNHERLKSYILAMDVAKKVPDMLSSLPLGSYYLADQLKRAVSSILLNQAEGNGRRSIKERRRFFDIAIGSATESAAIFDIIYTYGYIDQLTYNEMKDKLEQVVRILYKLN
jgi:four helix bundle protein